MTKNITAVLFALLLSAAVFAQYRPTSGGAYGPSYLPSSQPLQNHSSSVNDAILQESNAIARAFSPYNQSVSLPEKVKTRVTLEYIITDNIQAWDEYGRIHTTGQLLSYDRPAVFLPSKDKNFHLVAVPAADMQGVMGETFGISYSTTLIAGKKASVKLSNQFSRNKKGCPAGMTLRHAQNNQEADICIFQVNSRGLKDKFQKIFSNNNVTPAMAAQALKK